MISSIYADKVTNLVNLQGQTSAIGLKIDELTVWHKKPLSAQRLFIFVTQLKMSICLDKVTNLVNQYANLGDRVVELQNHELNEQLILINQLDEDEKNALVKIINSMLTKKRMKDLLDGKINF